MGNGSLTFSLVNLKRYDYKTSTPWEETKDLKIAEAFGTYCLYEDPTLPKDAPQPVRLDVGKTTLSYIRDTYHSVASGTRYKNYLAWWWNFQDEVVYLTPKEADVMSLYWTDLWNTVLQRSEEEYPMNTGDIRKVFKEFGDTLTYAAIRGLCVRIDHDNGY
jgi:hypothetical protein